VELLLHSPAHLHSAVLSLAQRQIYLTLFVYSFPPFFCILLSSLFYNLFSRFANLISFQQSIKFLFSLCSLLLDAFFRPIISCRSFVYLLPLLFLSNKFSNSCLSYVLVHIFALIIFYIYCPSLFFSANFLFVPISPLKFSFLIKLVPFNYHS